MRLTSPQQANASFENKIPEGEYRFVAQDGTSFEQKTYCERYCDKKGMQFFTVKGVAKVVVQEESAPKETVITETTEGVVNTPKKHRKKKNRK